MRIFLVCCLTLFTFINLDAQVTGLVTDTEGTPLPFVNIHVDGKSIGTSTNMEGYYSLEIDTGSYTINFQYIGYKTAQKTIDIDEQGIELNISLSPDNYRIDEVIIAADAEDPAYAIIRKAQDQRKKHLGKLNNYICDAYMRGFNEVLSTPDKIMGMNMDELDEILEEDRKGVLYLSESVSKIYKRAPEKKEVMYSSKVSGDDQGYSFNSAKEMDFSFYNNTINLNRDLISPIAWNALSHYDYKLIGATYEGKQLINKIEVIPKNKYGNVLSGHIYINEDLWNISSLELTATKHATQIPFIDSLTLTQIHSPVEDGSWVQLSSVIYFKAGMLGFNFRGTFAAIFSNYKMGAATKADFTNEVFKVEEEANDRSDEYWDTLRPIPLTKTEKLDYHRTDSITIVKSSPEYLDSIDRKANKFQFGELLTGYSHQNSINKTSYSITSPLSKLSVNTIQGWNSNLGIEWKKSYDKHNNRRLQAGLDFNYGFSEKVMRPDLNLNYRANRINNTTINLGAGRSISQFLRTNPITPFHNSIYTLFFRENHLKAYDKKYLSLRFSRQIINGLRGALSINYEDRQPLVNQFSGGRKVEGKEFTSNNPAPLEDNFVTTPHQAAIFRAHLILNPKQEVWTYPDRVYRENSAWPQLGLYYKGGWRIAGADTDYHLLYASVDKEFDISILGRSKTYVIGGGFLGAKPEFFIDNMHFRGSQIHIGTPGNYHFSFLRLPYYDMSTSSYFLQAHLEHDFDGYVLSKVPLLKATGWQFVMSYKYLYTKDKGQYDEIIFGLDNFGFKLFRLLRLDLVLSRRYSNPQQPDISLPKRKAGFVVGVKSEF